MADARPLEEVKHNAKKSHLRSDSQCVGACRPGRTVTINAQRSEADVNRYEEDGQYSDVEEGDDTDEYVSSIEDVNINDESDDDGVLYQLCEPEPVVERTQATSSRSQKKTLLTQSGEHKTSRSSSSGAKARERSHDGRFKSSKASGYCTHQSHGRKDVQPSQPMFKLEGRTAGDELNKRSRAQCSDLITSTNRKPRQMLQQTESIGRHIDNDRFRTQRKASPSPCMKKSYRRYERSISPKEYFSDEDEENMYPWRPYDRRKQQKIPNRNADSERELSRGRQKLAGRDASKENHYLSDDAKKSNHRHRRSVTDDRHRGESSLSPSEYTKKSSHRYERSFSRDGYCSDSEYEEDGVSSQQFDGGKQSESETYEL